MKIADIYNLKKDNKRFSCLTCYDNYTAKILNEIGVETILVGDSAAQVVLGHDSTLPATMDYMVTITAAVKRGAPDSLIIADMPFLSYQLSVEDALRNAGRFIVEAGADIIKIESTEASLDTIKAISDAGIAVMAHIGIRPQTIGLTGKLKAEGTTAQQACELIRLADNMVEAGAQMLLLEGTAREVSKIITERVSVPVIGCGAGPDCDGHVLVINDVLGLSAGGPKPKFVKTYANIAESIAAAASQYRKEVVQGEFPDDQHSYHIKKGELEKLEAML